MPKMAPRNKKATFTWLISKTLCNPTAYCAFEDAYNSKVAGFNAIYDIATPPLKGLLDTELLAVDASADANPADYVTAQTKMDAWEAVFTAMKSYLEAATAFENRDKTKVPEDSDTDFGRRAAAIVAGVKAFVAQDFSTATAALQQLASDHASAGVEHAKNVKIET